MTARDPLPGVEEGLRIRRRTLAAELERLNEPPAEGSSVGFGKRIGDGTTEAVERISSTATSRSIAATLEEIDRALARIEDGRYGLCVSCGDEISPDRLEARPEASLCIDCASR